MAWPGRDSNYLDIPRMPVPAHSEQDKRPVSNASGGGTLGAPRCHPIYVSPNASQKDGIHTFRGRYRAILPGMLHCRSTRLELSSQFGRDCQSAGEKDNLTVSFPFT